MKCIWKPQKFLYSTMVNPPASSEQFFPGKKRFQREGRIKQTIFGLGWSLINSERYSVWAVISPETAIPHKKPVNPSSWDCLRGNKQKKAEELKCSSSRTHRDNKGTMTEPKVKALLCLWGPSGDFTVLSGLGRADTQRTNNYTCSSQMTQILAGTI